LPLQQSPSWRQALAGEVQHVPFGPQVSQHAVVNAEHRVPPGAQQKPDPTETPEMPEMTQDRLQHWALDVQAAPGGSQQMSSKPR
jgi:hypothetical protein